MKNYCARLLVLGSLGACLQARDPDAATYSESVRGSAVLNEGGMDMDYAGVYGHRRTFDEKDEEKEKGDTAELQAVDIQLYQQKKGSETEGLYVFTFTFEKTFAKKVFEGEWGNEVLAGALGKEAPAAPAVSPTDENAAIKETVTSLGEKGFAPIKGWTEVSDHMTVSFALDYWKKKTIGFQDPSSSGLRLSRADSVSAFAFGKLHPPSASTSQGTASTESEAISDIIVSNVASNTGGDETSTKGTIWQEGHLDFPAVYAAAHQIRVVLPAYCIEVFDKEKFSGTITLTPKPSDKENAKALTFPINLASLTTE